MRTELGDGDDDTKDGESGDDAEGDDAGRHRLPKDMEQRSLIFISKLRGFSSQNFMFGYFQRSRWAWNTAFYRMSKVITISISEMWHDLS